MNFKTATRSDGNFTVSIRKERPGDIGGGQLYRPGDNLLDLNENPTLSPGR